MPQEYSNSVKLYDNAI